MGDTQADPSPEEGTPSVPIEAITAEINERVERPYPKYIEHVMSALAVAHDLLLGVVGYSLVKAPTVAIVLTLGQLATALDGLLIVGAVLGIIGNLVNKPAVQITGCVCMSTGLATWAVAILTQGHVTSAGVAVACVFLACSFSVGWRMFGILVGLYLRTRRF